MRTPSDSRTSALPVRLDTARLPCLATATPHDAVTIATVVEMLNVPALSPPVPQVSSSGERRVRIGWTRARIAAAMPAISSGVSPFMRSATASPPIWAGEASPVSTCSMLACARSRDRSCLSTARAMAVWIIGGPRSRRRRHAVLAAQREEVLDQPQSGTRQHRLGMELHPPRLVVAVLEAHDLALRRPRHHLE